jgi:hypothetical protein
VPAPKATSNCQASSMPWSNSSAKPTLVPCVTPGEAGDAASRVRVRL